ncbi:hypothetical protein FRC12_005065 [Ceratobasidium sp. 428]|nr:hypothetical protein FRC12_005065 [Ceratobasidium sp. 428]
MPAPTSNDLHAAIVRLLMTGHSPKEAATLTSRSVHTFLAEQLNQSPNLYLEEVQHKLSTVCGVDMGIGTLSDVIKRAGITRKKVNA